ncbi:MAG: hypothetical protein ONB45_17075 [candidate division KSB1 bacterium]|nr:hypothetical protein [candidate division KSB1 bacterium]
MGILPASSEAGLLKKRDEFVKIIGKESDNFNLSYRYTIYQLGKSRSGLWFSSVEYVRYYPKEGKFESLGTVLPQKIMDYYALKTNNPRPSFINKLVLYYKGLETYITVILALIFWIVGELIFRFLFFPILLIVKIALGLLTFIDFLGFLGLSFAKKLSAIVSVDPIQEFVGLKGGITPLASWHNFLVTLLIFICGFVIIIISRTGYCITHSKSPEECAELIGKKIPEVDERLAVISGGILVILALMYSFGSLVPPFSIWLRGLIFICLGVSLVSERIEE